MMSDQAVCGCLGCYSPSSVECRSRFGKNITTVATISIINSHNCALEGDSSNDKELISTVRLGVCVGSETDDPRIDLYHCHMLP